MHPGTPDPAMADLRIASADLEDESLQALIRLHLSAMRAHSPADSVHALDASALAEPGVDLFVLSDGGRALAMGALRRIDGTSFEIKSMRTLPDHTGRGFGRAVLEHLIAVATQRGARRLSLETGSGASFEPALSLYRSRGFQSGPAFGGYAATDFNQFLHLDLGESQ